MSCDVPERPCPRQRVRGSPLQRAFHEALEEEPLRQRKGDDARRHDDDVDGGEGWPRPLPLTALGGRENHRHRPFGLVIHERPHKRYSPHAATKLTMKITTSPFRTMGRPISPKARQWPAPSIL